VPVSPGNEKRDNVRMRVSVEGFQGFDFILELFAFIIDELFQCEPIVDFNLSEPISCGHC